MNVARSRRGWPAWGSSLSNGTGARIQTSQRLWAPNSLVRRGRMAADKAHIPSEGSPLSACLPGPHCCSPAPTRCAAEVSPTHAEPAGQPILQDYSGGQSQRRQEGWARWLRPSSSQAGQSSPTGTVPVPSFPLSWALSSPRAGKRPLAEGSRWGASQKSTAAEGFQAEWTALGWKDTDKSWGTEKQHKAINNRNSDL